MPPPEELTDEWANSVTTEYETILAAEPVEDGGKKALADTITAGILLTSWLFDRSKGQYLKPKTRKPLNQETINLILRNRISDSKRKLDTISRDYQQKPNADMWQARAEAEISRLHTQLYLLGRGGLNQVAEADTDQLKKLINDQKGFLQRFREQLENGELSDLRALNRLRMYGDSAMTAYHAGREQAMIASGFTESRRYLSPAENCPDCVEYSEQGWQAIGVLPLPKTESQCVFNCLCRIEYR